MRRAAALAALAAVAVIWPAAAPAASASAAEGVRSGNTSLCRPYQHLDVNGSQGMRYTIYNDTFGSPRQCLANRDGAANFRVTASAAAAHGPKAQAFPDIYYGCSRGWCSPGTVLPQRVSALNRPETSWYTTDRAGGRWNTSYDLWFPRTRQTSGQANGAELMIWLNERGFRVPAYDHGRYVRIEGTSWYLDHWRACWQRTCWNYVRFWRTRGTSYVHDLWLNLFIRAAESSGLIERSWWLESIAAGNELWQGGTGLATTRFWAKA